MTTGDVCRAGVSGGYLLVQEGRVVDKALMDYVSLPRRMLGRLLDVKCGPFFGGSSAEIGGWLEECREDGGCEKCIEGE